MQLNEFLLRLARPGPRVITLRQMLQITFAHEAVSCEPRCVEADVREIHVLRTIAICQEDGPHAAAAGVATARRASGRVIELAWCIGTGHLWAPRPSTGRPLAH